jgi:cyclophilin family peptidyl-prolyl cis-trans isomerase
MRSFRVLLLVCSLLLAAAVLAAQGKTEPQKTTKTQDKTSMTSAKNIATVETSMGEFEIELYLSDAPKAVENFMKLADKKYYDGMRVHRVSKGFVVQTGDEKSKDPAKVKEWGTGGKSIWGTEFADELNPETPSYKEGYKKGVVAMANHGPNTNSSQFFVCLRDVSLPHLYTIFGKVVKGMEVVDKIGGVEIIAGMMGPTDGRPKSDVLIKKIAIKK